MRQGTAVEARLLRPRVALSTVVEALPKELAGKGVKTEMRTENLPDNLVRSCCYLCESGDGHPVAVCHRCGAFVCREHSVRLVHYPRRIPPGRLSRSRQERGHYVEIICEDCNRNELEAPLA